MSYINYLKPRLFKHTTGFIVWGDGVHLGDKFRGRVVSVTKLYPTGFTAMWSKNEFKPLVYGEKEGHITQGRA